MNIRLICMLPVLSALAACAHQGGVALPAPQTQPADRVINSYVGAGIESLPAAAASEYMSRELQALKKALSEHSANDWQLSQLSDGSIRLQASNALVFDTNSAELRPSALDACTKLARIAQSFDKTVIHVATSGRDATPVEFSQSLSDRRAAALTAYLSEQGLDQMRLRGEGMISAKAEGLVIVIKPVVTDAMPQAWMSPS